jgi:hypothetical protein
MSESAVFPVILKDSGLAEITVNIEVHGENEFNLLDALCRAIAEREVPPDECFGAFGWERSQLPIWRTRWVHDRRLHPEMAVIWHPNAIIPPAVVVEPKAIIYGRVGHSKMARYRP